MNPARLKDRITIQPRTTTTVVFGVSEEWTDVEDCEQRWARVIPLSSMQRLQFQQANATATHRILFRQEATLAGYDMGQVRFIWKGKILTLTSTAKSMGGAENFMEFVVYQGDEGMSDQAPPVITS